ncbi:MAG: T9SS C-terminal target domain-containing protein, partial [Euryarchaeota archaeon]|nr:T9SS C-terminal target domain-containing protein [Euryarchaeota archaeon]
SGSQGYLDISLLTENEDSLILLYRESPAEDWDEYAHYEKDILGISVNAIGLMKLDKILPGEYVLASRDTSVLGLAEVPSLEYVIFPNPTGDEFNVEDSSGRVEVIRLYSTEGRLIKSASLIAGKASIDVSTLPAGMVVYELVGSRSEVLETGRLVVQ